MQQIQPLFSSDTSVPEETMSPASIPCSPNSFSMITGRRSFRKAMYSFRKLVLPAPRNPVMMVTGLACDDVPFIIFEIKCLSGFYHPAVSCFFSVFCHSSTALKPVSPVYCFLSIRYSESKVIALLYNSESAAPG